MQKRKARKEDFDWIYQVYMSDEVNPYMNFDNQTKEEFQEVFARFYEKLDIWEDDGNRVAMIVVEQDVNRRKHIFHMSKFAVSPSFQGKGYAKKIFAQILTEIKEKRGSRVELRVETDNHKAVSFYKKLGFEIEGTLKDSINREGVFIDDYIMGLSLI